MLPFLKKRDQSPSTVIVKTRESDSEKLQESGLKDCCKEILTAISANDANKLAETLRYAFMIIESDNNADMESNSQE